MELRTLQNFLMVIENQSITKAAASLHISQPALSKQIKTLEEELGKKLFIRHSYSLEPTEAGKLLAKSARDLIKISDKIKSEFSALDNIDGGDLYFGLAESYQIHYLAQIIKRFKKKYPNTVYHVTSGDTYIVLDQLDKGIIDFAVLVGQPQKEYSFLRFPESDRWGLVFQKDDYLAKNKTVTFDDLVDLPLFCSEQSWKEDIPRWCGDKIKDLKLEGSFRLAYNASVFVQEGLGYYLTLENLVQLGSESGLIFRPLEPTLTSDLYFVWRSNQVLSPIAKRFLECVQKEFGNTKQL